MPGIYLDNNATTPLDQAVLSKMTPFFAENFANPSSNHTPGAKAKQAVESSRELTAKAIGASSEEVTFTSGGTEANNLAIQGIAKKFLEDHKQPGHIISNRVEHSCVLNTLKNLDQQGWEISYVPVDKNGIINLESLKSAITENTCLVSVMLANNETGVIQNLQAICDIAHAKGIPVHSDAVQAIGKIPVNVNELGVELLALSAHKFKGPKGMGALFHKKRLTLKSIIFGGGQEQGLKPGTENTPGIIGLGEAISQATEKQAEYAEQTSQLVSALQKGIVDNIPNVNFNGAESPRIPNTLNVSFADIDAVSLQARLNSQGIFVSTGAACSSGATEVSHVLKWMKLPPKFTFSAIRFSVSRQTTMDEIERTIKILKKAHPSHV